MKITDNDLIVMSDGTEYCCHGGVIGLDVLGQGKKLRYGWDGGFDEESMTKEHKLELAEHMIAAWNTFVQELRREP